MRLSMVLSAAVLLLYTAIAASANVIYQFSGTTVTGLQEAFQYTSPSLITTVTAIPTSSLDSCTRCLYGPNVSIFFNPAPSGPSEYVVFADQNNTGYGYQFPSGSIGSLGTHQAFSSGPGLNIGTLTVSQSPPPTPAPASLILILTGLLAVSLYQTKCKRADLVVPKHNRAGSPS
jgi:hypothetical protein